MPLRFQGRLFIVEILFAESVACAACARERTTVMGLVAVRDPANLLMAFCGDDCMLDVLHSSRIDSSGNR